MTSLRTQTRCAALAVLLVLPAAAGAHDFWLQPERFAMAPNASIKVDMVIGHDGIVEPWNVRWERVVSLRSYGPRGMRDHQIGIVPTLGETGGGALVRLQEEGTHVLAFESHHSFSDLPAAKFNAYLELEGLTPAIRAREQAETSGESGREIYSRRAKTLIQVGSKRTDEALKPIGQTLEIVPDAHPHGVHGPDASLAFRILFQGRPLPGALVDIAPLDSVDREAMTQAERDQHDKLSKERKGQRSDAHGRVVFDLPYQGGWRVNVIWTRSLDKHATAQFETVFSSLSFEN